MHYYFDAAAQGQHEKRQQINQIHIYIQAYRGEDCFNMKGERIKSQSLDQNRRFKFNC